MKYDVIIIGSGLGGLECGYILTKKGYKICILEQHTQIGSAYGIQKNYNDVLGTIIAPQTQIPNLFLSGQNLNLHGITGVSMTSFFTCAKIVGMNNLLRDFNI
jgi:phytoene dehydrogenase-like protein